VQEFEVRESRGVDRYHWERDSIRGPGISAFRVKAIGNLAVEIARREVPRNFVDRGDHKSGDVAGDLGTSGLGS
jgi:hypothetical protein